MEIGSTISRARRQAALSQSELARRAGTSQPTISAYESGAKDPSVATLSRLLTAMGSRLEVRGVGERPRRASGPTMAERGRRLAEVLALAEALPGGRRRALEYPPLKR